MIPVTTVLKRNGESAPFNPDKLRQPIQFACYEFETEGCSDDRLMAGRGAERSARWSPQCLHQSGTFDAGRAVMATSISLLGSLDQAVVESTVDGPGFRLALFLAGCGHHCPGCHNPQSWDIAKGVRYPVVQVVDALSNWLQAGPYAGLTLSGGDPLFQAAATLELLEGLRSRHPDLNIWCYTGYRYEQVHEWPLLRFIDVLVDGPYVASLRRPSKPFRGSANQRLLYLEQGEVVREA